MNGPLWRSLDKPHIAVREYTFAEGTYVVAVELIKLNGGWWKSREVHRVTIGQALRALAKR